MKCSQCGGEVAADAKFCQRCGAAQGAAGVAAAGTAAAVPTPAQLADTAPLPPGMARRRPVVEVPEEVLWEGGFSPKAMIGAWIGAGLATVALAVAVFFMPEGWWWAPLAAAAAIWVLVGLRFLSLKLGVYYKLTNQRLIHERGVFSRTADRIEALEITDVTFHQTFVDRMFGVGDIKITSNDASTPYFSLMGIENVRDVFTLIDKARRAERLRRSVTVENLDS